MYNRIKKWYAAKLWTKDMVQQAVKKNTLTAEQYKEITGEEYA